LNERINACILQNDACIAVEYRWRYGRRFVSFSRTAHRHAIATVLSLFIFYSKLSNLAHFMEHPHVLLALLPLTWIRRCGSL